jgi:hypothetical protein
MQEIPPEMEAELMKGAEEVVAALRRDGIYVNLKAYNAYLRNELRIRLYGEGKEDQAPTGILEL